MTRTLFRNISIIRSILLSTAALAAGVAVARVMLTNSVRHATWVEVALVLALGWSFIASGLIAWRYRPENRIGPVMILTGVLRFVGALRWSQDPFLFTVGHTLEAAYLAGVAFILLAFPSGRLESTSGRWLFAAAVFPSVVLNVTWLALGGHDPQVCVGCPRNVLIELTQLPAIAYAVEIVQYILGALVAVFSFAVLLRRWRAAGPRLRFVIAPVLWVGAGAFGVFLLWLTNLFRAGVPLGAHLIHLLLRHGSAPDLLLDVVVALVAFAFLLGLLRTRLAHSAVADLVIELGTTPAPGELRAALGRALRDPSLEVAYWLADAGRYVDSRGQPVRLPDQKDGRSVTLVQRDGRMIAALVHDSALDEDQQLIESVGAAAALALENEQLQAELRARLDELAASRARIVEAAQAERQRIERDLHDGTQQRLVSLAMTLGLAEAKFAADPGAAQAYVREARSGLSEALQELRELSRGIHPAILTERGLREALGELIDRTRVPVALDVSLSERLPERVETAAYYLVSEALTNITKYAEATSVSVRVARINGRALIQVRDDGKGGAELSRGTGLRGLRDRVEALGGRLTLASPPGQGTVLKAEIPCE
ncbi:MAG TPA: sensor histidine kinase [Anaerolineales bacterium]|nr:sensor histidine kinase [Anaerolineales bacterium]